MVPSPSTLDVGAAMIKVTVTDSNAQNTESYDLDFGAISEGVQLILVARPISDYCRGMGRKPYTPYNFEALGTKLNPIVIDPMDDYELLQFGNGQNIGPSESLYTAGVSLQSIGSTTLFGFVVQHGIMGGGDRTYGWFNVTMDGTSSFTLNSYGYNSKLNEAAIAGQDGSAVPDTAPGFVGIALLGAGAAGMRLLRKLRASK